MRSSIVDYFRCKAYQLEFGREESCSDLIFFGTIKIFNFYLFSKYKKYFKII
jgi:hypothetical protein